eukprot:TRINITY_DN21464_c1_g1_i1.p2 TRINITY_DN21464_c1_g1~~TRINITY_DN21464_c1_g1_i1.p2  ORF type:complete len:197 (-),score=38.42 TRINITY_DN21464_c1_g1_i1:349-939(-)
MDDESILDEECVALESIFPDKFSRLNENTIRVVIEPPKEDDSQPGDIGQHALYLVMKMKEDYPESIPEFDLSNLNNVVFPQQVRDQVIEALKEQAEELVGDMMVYTLVEFIRDSLPDYNAQILEHKINEQPEEKEEIKISSKTAPITKETDNMTKAQKRRYFDKFGTTEKEKPRGWDWVDILSHLSQRPGPPRAET